MACRNQLNSNILRDHVALVPDDVCMIASLIHKSHSSGIDMRLTGRIIRFIVSQRSSRDDDQAVARMRVPFLGKGLSLLVLRGEIQHKDLWLIDLETGTELQLTQLAPDFNISNFDISTDGSELLLERVQERSSVVLIDLLQP